MRDGVAPLPATYDPKRVTICGPETEMISAQVSQLQGLVARMTQILDAQEKRIREMENREKRITISHAETLALMARIRAKADAYGEKYALTDRKSLGAFRTAIKKTILKENGIRDLHDLPEGESERAKRTIEGWTGIRLVMELRAKAGKESGP